MRISYNWLKDYIDIKLPPEKIAEILTMAGLAVDALQKTASGALLEIEVTANRPDWLSYVGVARELSALTGAKLKLPSRHCEPRRGEAIPLLEIASDASHPRNLRDCFVGLRPPRNDKYKRVSVRVEDNKLCPRYTARIIRDIKVGESPAWLKMKLEAMGLRSVNNIVDITNFCLFETGEPMHAFDLDKIGGTEVVVRTARPGEKIVTIDGVERGLDASHLVIADISRPIAIAGVMGGLDTEVTASTKNILLEAAYFDPVSIRRSSRRLSVSTESSYRFERRVDIANILYSSDRAAGFIAQIAGGEIGELVDIGAKKQAGRKTITLEYARLNSILGACIAPAEIKKMLNSLGLAARSPAKDRIKFEIPSFRYDLNNEIDLIEEVARIYGYDKIPATIPAVPGQPERLGRDIVVARRIRAVLTGLGVDEIITYSLIGRKALESAAVPDARAIEIANPLTNEQEVMRPSLMPGLLNAVLWNMNRKTKDLKLFELGKIYMKDAEGRFVEKQSLSLGVTGEIASWATGSRPVTIFDLKGIVETLFCELGIREVSFKYTRCEAFAALTCAAIQINGERVGTMGKSAKKMLDNFGIKDDVYICEIDADPVIRHADLKKAFVEPARYPSVSRDISIIVARDIANAQLVELMRAQATSILKRIGLIDRYEGKQVPEGKISLTYRLEYQDPNKTLEEKEVSAAHAKVLSALDEKFGAKLR